MLLSGAIKFNYNCLKQLIIKGFIKPYRNVKTGLQIMQSMRELEKLPIHLNNWALNKKRIILPNARMILFQHSGAKD
jgi:hypothetical protein